MVVECRTIFHIFGQHRRRFHIPSAFTVKSTWCGTIRREFRYVHIYCGRYHGLWCWIGVIVVATPRTTMDLFRPSTSMQKGNMRILFTTRISPRQYNLEMPEFPKQKVKSIWPRLQRQSMVGTLLMRTSSGTSTNND